jgi:dipicolinate synthase subunit A
MTGTVIPVSDTENPAPPDPRPAVIAIGGDARQTEVIRTLSDAGYTVSAVGVGNAETLPAGVRRYARLLRSPEDISIDAPATPEADSHGVLLLPLPVSRDGETVCCPLDPEAHVTLADVAEWMTVCPFWTLVGGRLPTDFAHRLARTCGRERVIDYYEREDVQIKNARITAEGAVMTAMERTDTAILSGHMAVVGYGRIGRFLAGLLRGFNADVTVCARRGEVLAQAACDGNRTLRLRGAREDLLPLCHGYDVIFNTVPAPLFGLEVMEAMDAHTLLIDLASAPGGVDAEAVRLFFEQGEGRTARPQMVCVPSLPGRYAPRTAGQVIAQAVLDILRGGA